MVSMNYAKMVPTNGSIGLGVEKRTFIGQGGVEFNGADMGRGGQRSERALKGLTLVQ